MASLRFSFTNKVQTATLKNGTGGGAPALDQVSPWLMTNSQNRDRELVWQQSSGASGFVDFDLTGAASDTSVGLLAVLGHRGAPATAGSSLPTARTRRRSMLGTWTRATPTNPIRMADGLISAHTLPWEIW